jgi:hypothetical protein
MTRLRLPIVTDPPEEDPFVLLRGGRFARWFASSLAVLGLAWIVSARVAARDADVVLVHSALQSDAALAAVARPAAAAGRGHHAAPW